MRMRCIWLDLYEMNYSSHRIIFLFNVEIGRIFYRRNRKIRIVFSSLLLSGSLLTEQLPPGKVGHKEVTHVEDADDDTHGPHGQTRVNVPGKQQIQIQFSVCCHHFNRFIVGQ